MARGLATAVKNELATGNISPVFLVHLGFATPIYLTNSSFPLTSSVSGSSITYTASGHLRSITGVSETNSPTKNSLAVQLSGVDQTYTAVILNENIIGKEVKIYRGLLNSSNALISDPFLLFYGTIDQYKIVDNYNSRNELIVYFINLHNNVNLRNKKPLFNRNQVDEIYLNFNDSNLIEYKLNIKKLYNEGAIYKLPDIINSFTRQKILKEFGLMEFA